MGPRKSTARANHLAFAARVAHRTGHGHDPLPRPAPPPDRAGGGPRKVGALEESHGGTLYIDEVAYRPIETQGKILRVRLIMKEGAKLFDPVYLFDEGSTISWIPCGRKLTCSFPGIKFYYGPDTWCVVWAWSGGPPERVRCVSGAAAGRRTLPKLSTRSSSSLRLRSSLRHAMRAPRRPFLRAR
jgi:hypothetical protein